MVFMQKLSFLINNFTTSSVQIFILRGTNSRQQHLELIVLTEPVWLTVFCFKIIFQVQVLKPKDLFRILSPRRCVVIIYKIRCEVTVVKVKMSHFIYVNILCKICMHGFEKNRLQ